MRFFLGTHQPHWLRLLSIPLMVSHRTLARYRVLPRAAGVWFKDSGGFTQLQMHGSWDGLPAAQFVAETRRYALEVGSMQYAAPRDWMCEPIILAKTGLSIAEHQRRTVADYLDLREKAPEIPWTPVLQGWKLSDYLRCLEMYDQAGVELIVSEAEARQRYARRIGKVPDQLTEEEQARALAAERPLVGVGTICRRQGTDEAARILGRLAAEGLRLHAFGLKIQGIPRAAAYLASSDSLAWSYAARREQPLPGCTTHKNCANCLHYALKWLSQVERAIGESAAQPYQQMMVL